MGASVSLRLSSSTQNGIEPPGGVLRVSPEFGTCSDIIYPTFDSKVGVTVAMVGFRGPFEPATEQRKAAMTKTVYRWDGQGQLTGNRKPVR